MAAQSIARSGSGNQAARGDDGDVDEIGEGGVGGEEMLFVREGQVMRSGRMRIEGRGLANLHDWQVMAYLKVAVGIPGRDRHAKVAL